METILVVIEIFRGLNLETGGRREKIGIMQIWDLRGVHKDENFFIKSVREREVVLIEPRRGPGK